MDAMLHVYLGVYFARTGKQGMNKLTNIDPNTPVPSHLGGATTNWADISRLPSLLGSYLVAKPIWSSKFPEDKLLILLGDM